MKNVTNNLSNLNEDKPDNESDPSDKKKLPAKTTENDNREGTQLNVNQNKSKDSTSTSYNDASNRLPSNQSPSYVSGSNSLNQTNFQHNFNSDASVNSQSSQNPQAKREQALEDEATRLFLDMASDPEMINQAISAAVNPNVAKELARQADTAWRNIETVPGGYQALCQMHNNIQHPLWNAVMGREVATPSKNTSDIKLPVHNEPIKVNAMPNPWKTMTQHQQQPSLSSIPTPYLFSDFSPLSYLTGSIPELTDSISSDSSNEVLSSVINRTSPTSFQTASQLIQNNSSSKYSREIEELAQMGITDREKCLIALEAADGDIFQALGILEELEKEEAQDK